MMALSGRNAAEKEAVRATSKAARGTQQSREGHTAKPRGAHSMRDKTDQQAEKILKIALEAEKGSL
jgi:hypothetical protein